MNTVSVIVIFSFCVAVIVAAVCLAFSVSTKKFSKKTVLIIASVLLICAIAMIISAAKISEPATINPDPFNDDPGRNDPPKYNTVTAERYNGRYSKTNGALAAIDGLGRVLPEDAEKKDGKTVGIFYFFGSAGDENAVIYDVNEILKKDPLAYQSIERWKSAGGPYNGTCYYGKPIFGYYSSQDEWVIGRHAMMLAETGIDYIIFDSTNGPQCMDTIEIILRVFDRYYNMGVEVPKVAFYTNTNAEMTANIIYNKIYKPNKVKYDHLWFKWDGKPLIITDPDGKFSEEFKNYFTIKDSLWPNDDKYSANSFPWMEFDRLYTSKAVYGRNGRREILSVSPAQHCDTIMFSETAWYGGNDHTRSWHNGANDLRPDAYLYGYNFAEQWEWALEQNTESVFVTGFNEWCAVVTTFGSEYGPVQMCDNATMNCSRDVEPMSGGYGDNYLMQLASFIRLYKGCEDRVDIGEDKVIDINGPFSQFDGAAAVYTDPAGDTEKRDHKGWGEYYTDNSGRNDIETIKVIKNNDKVYFYIKTAETLTEPSERGWMTLFIDTGAEGGFGNSYDIAVSRTAPDGNKTSVEQYENGEWKRIGSAKIRYEGGEMMIEIDRGYVYDESAGGLWNIRFKVADNYVDGDVMSFYTSGDCAPYGRYSFVFSEKK